MRNKSSFLYHRDALRFADRPLYKYQTRKNAQRTIEEGSFRIGTLYDYRNVELHGSEIGDAGEGTLSVKNAIGEDLILDGRDSRAESFVHSFFPQFQGRNAWISGIQFQRRHNSPDYYLYCVSSEISERAMQDFKCDTVIEISNWIEFFTQLRLSILTKYRVERVCRIMPCEYASSRHIHYSEPTPYDIVQLKPNRMAYQQEIRAVWTPKSSKPIEPIVVYSPKARKYCRIIDI